MNRDWEQEFNICPNNVNLFGLLLKQPYSKELINTYLQLPDMGGSKRIIGSVLYQRNLNYLLRKNTGCGRGSVRQEIAILRQSISKSETLRNETRKLTQIENVDKLLTSQKQ